MFGTVGCATLTIVSLSHLEGDMAYLRLLCSSTRVRMCVCYNLTTAKSRLKFQLVKYTLAPYMTLAAVLSIAVILFLLVDFLLLISLCVSGLYFVKVLYYSSPHISKSFHDFNEQRKCGCKGILLSKGKNNFTCQKILAQFEHKAQIVLV